MASLLMAMFGMLACGFVCALLFRRAKERKRERQGFDVLPPR
jgi:hypothetical protein